jgi:hypothetical protein
MANDELNITINLPFPTAGVNFNIKMNSADGSSGTFSLNVSNLATGDAVPFTVESSPALADWVRGYSRWLYRARVSASHDVDSITGTIIEGTTPEQALEGMQEACDMIRQRFGIYAESVLEQ